MVVVSSEVASVSAWLGQRGWYGDAGAVEVQWLRLRRFLPEISLRRNGRCLEVTASIGDLWVSAVVYRHWGHE